MTSYDTILSIGKLSADLHAKLITFDKHYSKPGNALGKAVKSYNDGVGS